LESLLETLDGSHEFFQVSLETVDLLLLLLNLVLILTASLNHAAAFSEEGLEFSSNEDNTESISFIGSNESLDLLILLSDREFVLRNLDGEFTDLGAKSITVLEELLVDAFKFLLGSLEGFNFLAGCVL
jgi:hypothetical protein